MADREESIRIVIDSGRAMAGLRALGTGIDDVSRRARIASEAIEKLGAARPGRTAAPAVAGRVTRAIESEAAALERAERRKTAAVRAESAVRLAHLRDEARERVRAAAQEGTRGEAARPARAAAAPQAPGQVDRSLEDARGRAEAAGRAARAAAADLTGIARDQANARTAIAERESARILEIARAEETALRRIREAEGRRLPVRDAGGRFTSTTTAAPVSTPAPAARPTPRAAAVPADTRGRAVAEQSETAVTAAEARKQVAAAQRAQEQRTAAAAAGTAERERLAQRETDAITRAAEGQSRPRDARGRFTAAAAPDLSAPSPSRPSGFDALPMPKINLDTSGAIQQVNNLRGAFDRLQDSAVSLNGILAGIGAGAMARDITQAGIAFQALKTGLDVAAGSTTKGAQEMERLRAETHRLGISTPVTGKEYTRFVAAISAGNVDMAKARETFFSVAQAMALLGKTPEEAGRAFTALTQIASRGVVQMDELGEQLGEQLPATMDIAANAMGMSLQQLQKTMEAGRFTAREFFDTFGGGVATKYPLIGDMQGAAAELARLGNAFDDFKVRVAEGGFLNAVAAGAKELARALSGVEGKRLAEELGGLLKTAVEGLVEAFKVLAENIQVVVNVVGGLIAIKLAGWVLGVVGALANLGTTLFNVGRAFAAHPLIGLSLALTGAVAALAQTNGSLQAVDATAKQHAKALSEIEDLHKKIATAAGNEKAAAVDRAKAIIDSSKQVQAELEKELAQRRALIDEEAAIERRASPGGQSTFGPTQEGSRETLYNTGQLDRQIAEARERTAAAEAALRGTRPGAASDDTLTNQQRSTKELEKQTAEIRKQVEGQEKQARQFERSKEAAVGVKRELEIISRTRPLEFRISEQTKAEIADLNARIEATRQKIRENPDDSALRVDLAGLVGQVAAKERMPEGQMLPEDVDKLRQSYRDLDAARDQLAVGPILQTLRSEIELTNRMAEAHKRGTDAVDDEKNAQDARNRILEAGIDITGRAANAIYELVAAHNRAQELEAIQLKVAEQERKVQANKVEANILDTVQGPDRARMIAQFRAQAEAGNTPGPTVDNLLPLAIGNTEASNRELERRKELEQEKIKTEAAKRQTRVGGVKSPQAAFDAALQDAIGDIRIQRGYGPEGKLPPEDEEIARQRAEQGRQSYIQRQQNKTGRTKQDVFGERSRELGQSIDAQRELASAYGQSAEAVEQATRSQEIMNKVHGFSEKLTKDQKAALEGLVGTLYDVQKAAKFEAAQFGLREGITEAEALAAAHDKGVDAANREKDALEARRMAIELGVVSDRDAVRSLEQLIAKRREAAQDERLAEEIAANRRYVGSLDEVRAAYGKVGEARVRALAEVGARQELLDQGANPESQRGQQFVASEGDRAVGDWRAAAEDRIRLGQAEVEGTGRQMEAMRLFGEERVRRMGEIQKENELIAANGSATDALSQNQIRLAGDAAVASDRLAQMNDSLDQLANSIPNMTVALRDAAFSGLMHFEDALVGIVTGTKSAREAFADMAKSIAADLARMAIRMAIIQPLAMMFGGGAMFGAQAGMMGVTMATNISQAPTSTSFGGMGAGQWHEGGIVGTDTVPIRHLPLFHSGGVVGTDRTPIRAMPAIRLASVPRFHSGGLAGGEMPAILKRGEGVFTPAQMKALAPVGGPGGGAAGGSPTVNNISVNVTAQQGVSNGDAERQGRLIAQQIEQAMNEKLSKELRNGGILNPNGY